MTRSIHKILPAIVLLGFFIAGIGSVSAQNGKVFGRVIDNGDTLIYTTVRLQQGQTIFQQTMTDMEGRYEFANIEPGAYEVVVITLEDELPFEMTVASGETKIKNLTWYEVGTGAPIYSEDVFTVDPMIITTLDKETIGRIGIRDPEDLAAITQGVYQADQGRGLSIRGARPEGTVYFVNGVKVYGSDIGLPQGSIRQIDVIAGGIPASIGDVTGGAIMITTDHGLKGSAAPYYTREERREIRRRKRGKGNGTYINGENQTLTASI